MLSFIQFILVQGQTLDPEKKDGLTIYFISLSNAFIRSSYNLILSIFSAFQRENSKHQ